MSTDNLTAHLAYIVQNAELNKKFYVPMPTLEIKE